MDLSVIATLIGIPVLRSVMGWATNALEDGKISAFEWQQLGSTILRVGFIGFAAFFGLNGMGIDVDALGAGFSAVLMDFLLSALKNKKKK